MNRSESYFSLLWRPSLVATTFLLAAFGAQACNPAYAGLIITPTFDSTITSDPNAAAIEGVINNAIGIYEADFSDPINVTIDFKEMSSGLGGSLVTEYKIPYSTFYNALAADATTSNDATAMAHLNSGTNTFNPVTGSTNIDVKTANLRAVGIFGDNSGLPGGYDGVISLNTHITDVGSPGTSGVYSLAATAEHEIDEVLGLGSDVSGTGFFSDPLPEDLFRYASNGSRSYTSNTSANAFFSIDGTTDLAQFDNQNDGGDWGDWQSNPLPNGVQPEVQDAFATPNSHPTLGVELTALDVIGYNLESGAGPVPEPGSMTLAALGAVGLAICSRRKLAKKFAG